MKPKLFHPLNVIVQGITGTHGSFHALKMNDAGTNIVAGTSPNKAGTFVHDIPVYSSIENIQADFTIDASVIFVPAPYAKAAILEAVHANIPLIVCITEGIPVHDMITINKHLKKSDSVLLGPNCPGLIIPNRMKLGIIPAPMTLPGTVGVVSRSGTLTYEVAAGLTAREIGQSYVIGIGGDPIHGVSFTDCLKLFQDDPNVKEIVMIGEIGGTEETEAAAFIQSSISKPVFGYIAGHTAPKGVQLGHAGAILGSENESAEAKTLTLEQAGVKMSRSIVDLIASVK